LTSKKDLEIIITGLTIPFTGLKRQYENLRGEILDIADLVFSSGQLMSGPHTQAFEKWLADKNQVRHAVTCHSGTNALEIIANYWVNRTSITTPRVVIPTMTYAATANAFIQAGWEVIFADTDPYGVIDFEKLHDVAFEAIVLIGLYGAKIPSEWEHRLLSDVLVIEDAAQHWLADNCTRGPHAAAVSFDPTKNFPCYGNGGAVLTNSIGLAEFADAWRRNGIPNGNQHVGSNSRMSELDCALMMVKSQYLDEWQERRKTIAEYYIDQFRSANIRCLIDETNQPGHSYHKFVIDIAYRDTVQKELLACGIETKIHYTRPLHEVGMFSRYTGPDLLSCASSLARRVLSLPIYPELTDNEVEYIANQVIDRVSQTRS
jgi:dTDP-4-amino-4,6-dideoxygalactose transaminase